MLVAQLRDLADMHLSPEHFTVNGMLLEAAASHDLSRSLAPPSSANAPEECGPAHAPRAAIPRATSPAFSTLIESSPAATRV
jgi:hypothetical protein